MNFTMSESKSIKSSRVKPVFIMHQEGLSDLEKKAVLDGASELIKLAEVDGVKVVDWGVWRKKGFRDDDGSLKDFWSVDWYVKRGSDDGRDHTKHGRQLNAGTMQDCLSSEPWRDPERKGRDHYDILVVHSDMYFGGRRFVIGVAQPGIGTTISTYRFRRRNRDPRYECVKTETMHELGHVFGLLPLERTEDIRYKYGKHCTNKCIMRQGVTLPTDWVRFTEDRLRQGALCPRCKEDLRAYFRE
jgi:predicted Zn-dependent protease